MVKQSDLEMRGILGSAGIMRIQIHTSQLEKLKILPEIYLTTITPAQG